MALFSKTSLTSLAIARAGPCLQLDLGESKNAGDDGGKTEVISGQTSLGATCVSKVCSYEGRELLVSYQRSKGLSSSLAWAAASLAGEDPLIRQRWKSPQRCSGVELGRHLQKSPVKSISESRASFEVTTPLRDPLSF